MELFVSFIGWFLIGIMTVVGLSIILIPACLIYDSMYLSFKRFLKDARKWHRYEITKTSNMFGIYSWEKNYVSSYTPLANSPRHALKRYFRHYHRKYKECATGSMNSPTETTHEWARYMVKDITTGYKTYFH